MPASSYMVGDCNYSCQYQSNKSSSIGKYNHKDQQQQLYKEESEAMSSSRFGNFSRVSQQASPISGRKTKYSSYKQSKIGGKVNLMPC